MSLWLVPWATSAAPFTKHSSNAGFLVTVLSRKGGHSSTLAPHPRLAV